MQPTSPFRSLLAALCAVALLPIIGPTTAAAQSSTYDFQPGERTLFASDFSGDNLGDFPRGLQFIQGNMQVVEMDGRRVLQGDARRSRFSVLLPEVLPQTFTIEFEAYEPRRGVGVAIALSEPPNFGWAWSADYEQNFFNAGDSHGSGVWGDGGQLSTTKTSAMMDGFVPVRIMVDGAHAKMFMGTTRVANVPTAQLPRTDRIYFLFDPAPPDAPVYITGIRIAAGGRDLYEAIEAAGRVEIHDILFDTGSATIRPESEPILAQIAAMLEQHPDLRVVIEGHTDSQGEFDMNVRLSADRATSVKSWLVDRNGVAPSRLYTIGMGPARPVASNETPEGRQRNRRVELARLQ